MKKSIKIILLSMLISFAPVQQAKAAIAAVVAIWNPITAVTVAMYGLGAPLVGGALWTIIWDFEGRTVAGLVLGGVLGLVILDEEGKPVFSELSKGDAAELNISMKQAEIYNNELEEINLILQEVSSQVTKESTALEVKSLWQQYADFLSPESLEVMEIISRNSITRVYE